MDPFDLDADKLQEILSVLKDAGVRRFKYNGMLIEFADEVGESKTAGFAPRDSKSPDEKHPGYSHLFGGQLPRFVPTAPVSNG